jgi:cell division transport system ATP-binding protein
VIEFEDAGFSRGGMTVLHDITLSLDPGSFTFLLGSTGAGKSTLLRLCYLDLAPTVGTIRFFGRPVGRADRNAVADLRRSIGILHQECHFLDHLPLVENVALPLRVSGIGAGVRAEDLQALLEWVELAPFADRLPPALSAGQRQLAALARAVILSPELILADEPTGNVDWSVARQLIGLLVELNRMGKTILVATHDNNLVRVVNAQVPVEIVHLERGRLQMAEALA